MFFNPVLAVGTTPLILVKLEADTDTLSLLQVYEAVVPSKVRTIWLSVLKTVLLVQYWVVPDGFGIKDTNNKKKKKNMR